MKQNAGLPPAAFGHPSKLDLKRSHKCSSNGGSKQRTHRVGDLLWVRTVDCPYWPCIVQKPHSGGSAYRSDSSNLPSYYHVRFFGDVPETAWVPDDANVLPFKLKHQRRWQFHIPARLRAAWEAARDQAVTAASASAAVAAAASSTAAGGEESDESDTLIDSLLESVLARPAVGDSAAETASLEFHRLKPAPRGVIRPAPGVCDLCENELGVDGGEDDAVAACPNRCGRVGHSHCLGSASDGCPCGCCTKGLPVRCFLCNSATADTSNSIGNGTDSVSPLENGEILRCRVRGCGRVYHANCVAGVGGGVGPGAAFRRTGRGAAGDGGGDGGGLVCPQHECLTCRLAPPKQALAPGSSTRRLRLLRCVRCPAAYHAGQRCLPAGSRLLGSGKGYLVCPAHADAADAPASMDRCLACCRRSGVTEESTSSAKRSRMSAGPLLRCRRCPAAYHRACLPTSAALSDPAVDFLCSECRPLNHPAPRYGDIVWARPHLQRPWWPAEVLHPQPGVTSKSATTAAFAFPVRFFGEFSEALSLTTAGVGAADGIAWLTRARVLDFDLAEACLAGGDCDGDSVDKDATADAAVENGTDGGAENPRLAAIRLAKSARDCLRAARTAAAVDAQQPRIYRRRRRDGLIANGNGIDGGSGSSESSSSSGSDDDDVDNEDDTARPAWPKRPPPFKLIKVNYPIGSTRLIKPDLSDLPRCDCPADAPDPCGSDASCLNRALSYECHPSVCPAGERCQNRRFATRAYPPQEVFRTADGRGWGLRACASIAKGDFVNEYIGDLIDPDEAQRRLEAASAAGVREFYMLTLDKQRVIDAGPRGNISRFLNHSCTPNLQARKWSVAGDLRIGLFALRNIVPGEELTFNYRFQWFGDDGNGERKIACRCGAANCVGFLGGAVATQPLAVDSQLPPAAAGVKRPRGRPRLYPAHRALSTASTSTTSTSAATEAMETAGSPGAAAADAPDATENGARIGSGGWRRRGGAPGLGVWRGRGRGRGRPRGRSRGGGAAGVLRNGWIGSGMTRRLAHDNECFRCGDGGHLILCSKDSCPKAYHADCLGLSKAPFGRWICPWHHCDECGSASNRLCSACTASYCDQHADGKFVKVEAESGGGSDCLLCLDHSRDDVDDDSMDQAGREASAADADAADDADDADDPDEVEDDD